MTDERINLLKNEPIKKAVNKMAAPAIIGLLVMAIYNIVDTMFVAWIGTSATGATQVIMPIMMLASSIGLMFGIGGGSYLSRLLGKGDIHEAEKVASTSFFSGIIAGVFFLIVNLVFFEPILAFFGAEGDIMTLAKTYGVWIVVGSVVMVSNMVLNNLLRSEGSGSLSMKGMAIGSILNMILDPIFIFVFKWGIAGAAIATTLSQTVTFIILLSSYLRHKTVVRLALQSFAPSLKIYKEILTVGLPTFFKQVLFSVSMALLNQNAMAYGGADLLAAMGIITRVMMISFNVVFGIGQGFQPVAGYNVGAGNKERVMESFRYTVLFSSVVTCVTAFVLVVFGESIMSMFKASTEVATYGLSGLRYYALGTILLGFTNTVTVFYQAMGKGRESLLLSVARQGIFFFPAIMILPGVLGTDGVMSSQLIADLFTLILALVMIIPFIKKDLIDKVFLEYAE